MACGGWPGLTGHGARRDEGCRPLHERSRSDWVPQFPADRFPRRTSVRFLPHLLRRPGSRWRAGTRARSADLARELGDLRGRGLPVAAVWADRDRVIPAAFRDLCPTRGADGHAVAGGHAWLLAEPAAVGELETNVAELAASTPAPARRRPHRRWFRRRRPPWASTARRPLVQPER